MSQKQLTLPLAQYVKKFWSVRTDLTHSKKKKNLFIQTVIKKVSGTWEEETISYTLQKNIQTTPSQTLKKHAVSSELNNMIELIYNYLKICLNHSSKLQVLIYSLINTNKKIYIHTNFPLKLSYIDVLQWAQSIQTNWAFHYYERSYPNGMNKQPID